MLREELLQRIVTEDDGTFIQTTNWEVHPLAVALKSDAILEILRKTTAEAASSPQHPPRQQRPDSPEHARREDVNVTDRVEDTQSDEDRRRTQDAQEETNRLGTQQQAGDMLRLLSHDGQEFQVPREIGTLLAELITKVKSLEDRLTNHQRQAASSTRTGDTRPGQNVHFDDTFGIPDEQDVWVRPPPQPQPARPREQADLRGVNAAWVGGDRRSSARSTSWPNGTAPGTSANFSRSGLYHSRDIGQIVRKWQIRFSGAKSQSIDVFLARLEDCRVLANLTEEEVLSSLSELFTDTAATWYRNEKEKLVRKLSPPPSPPTTAAGHGTEDGVRFRRGSTRVGSRRGTDVRKRKDVPTSATANPSPAAGNGVQAGSEK